MDNEELFIVEKEYRRLDLCLSEMTDLSRSRAQSLIEEGLVRHLRGEQAPGHGGPSGGRE